MGLRIPHRFSPFVNKYVPSFGTIFWPAINTMIKIPPLESEGNSQLKMILCRPDPSPEETGVMDQGYQCRKNFDLSQEDKNSSFAVLKPASGELS